MPQKKALWISAGAIGIAVAAVAIGLVVGYAMQQSTISDLKIQASKAEDLDKASKEQQARIEDLLVTSTQASARNDTLQKSIDSAQTQVAQLQGDLAKTQADLSAAKAQASDLPNVQAELARARKDVDVLSNLADKMDADRQLLIEMRKELPQDTTTGIQYFQNLKGVAVKSDTSLGPKGDKLVASAKVFYDWLNKSFSTDAERQLSYVLSGASQFQTNLQDFQRSALLVIANHLDTVLQKLP